MRRVWVGPSKVRIGQVDSSESDLSIGTVVKVRERIELNK